MARARHLGLLRSGVPPPGPNGECPSGLACSAEQFCEPMVAPMLDAAITDDAMSAPGCAKLNTQAFSAIACALAVAEPFKLSTSTVIDTDAGTSTPPGLTCAPLTQDSDPVCAIAAREITISAGVTLSARGAKPLVLIGHTLVIEGILDVASHARTPAVPGAASNPALCNLLGSQRPAGTGGAAGGSLGSSGGNGGDGNAGSDRGGRAGPSVTVNKLHGGCPGGSTSPQLSELGGAGGGAVWLAATTATGTITIAGSGLINASGAGGPGGTIAQARRGGSGGGSGGMILLQAGTLDLAASARLMADGGGGGGAASATGPGNAGGDPTLPGSGGSSGSAPTGAGGGGTGFPSPQRDGRSAASPGGGGGGGGGGAGVILFAVGVPAGASANVSPPPIHLAN